MRHIVSVYAHCLEVRDVMLQFAQNAHSAQNAQICRGVCARLRLFVRVKAGVVSSSLKGYVDHRCASYYILNIDTQVMHKTIVEDERAFERNLLKHIAQNNIVTNL